MVGRVILQLAYRLQENLYMVGLGSCEVVFDCVLKYTEGIELYGGNYER